MKWLHLLVAAVLSGCASTQNKSSFRIPERSAQTYAAADGRLWVVHETNRTNGGGFIIAFTPQVADRTGWTEMLVFDVDGSIVTMGRLAETFEKVRLENDPEFTYEATSSKAGYLIVYHAPKISENGISKTVFGLGTSTQVAYMSRLKDDPNKRWQFWLKYISNLPNQALEPMVTAVTDRAAHAPRQP